MRIKVQEARPVRRKDGSWTVVLNEFWKDIPDKGRGCVRCNACVHDEYPKCMSLCPIGKKRLAEQEDKKS